MTAYDPLALFSMERERLHRELENRRRRSESEEHRAARMTGSDADGVDAAARPARSARFGGIRRLLPGRA